MFDGPTTPGLDLDAPLVVLNLRAVLNTHTTALGILMTCATAWLQAHDRGGDRRAQREADRRRRRGLADPLQPRHRRVAAAVVQALARPRHAERRRHAPALRPARRRRRGQSREVRLAEGLLADAETKVVYAQPPDQLAQARELLGLTDTEAELLPHLRRGWALWKVGQRSFLVQHRLSPLEREIVDTDARMAVRSGGMNERHGTAPRFPRRLGAEPHPLETVALVDSRRAGRCSERSSGLPGELSGRLFGGVVAAGEPVRDGRCPRALPRHAGDPAERVARLGRDR